MNLQLTEIERRLEALERALMEERAAHAAAPSRVGPRAAWLIVAAACVLLPFVTSAQGKPPRMTVRAPFFIEDESGSVIFAVMTESVPVKDVSGNVTGAKDRPRLILGDPAGQRIQLNINSQEGGGIAILNASNVPAVLLQSTAASTSLWMAAGTATSAFIEATGAHTGLVFSRGERKAAVLESGDSGYGRLFLMNPKGDPVVEAGAIDPGIGMIRVGPKFPCPSGALTIPCQLRGRQ